MSARTATDQDAALDASIRDAIGLLLASRDEAATTCPSEVARAISDDGWREFMDDVRRVAVDEAAHGRLEIRQGGQRVDGPDFHGPIRLGRPR